MVGETRAELGRESPDMTEENSWFTRLLSVSGLPCMSSAGARKQEKNLSKLQQNSLTPVKWLYLVSEIVRELNNGERKICPHPRDPCIFDRSANRFILVYRHLCCSEIYICTPRGAGEAKVQVRRDWRAHSTRG